VARLLRHEVGDFLQGVFSLVAVLSSRLSPGQQLEQRLFGDVRRWAERVRMTVDGTVRLLSMGPAAPAEGWPVGDLTALMEGLLANERRAGPGPAEREQWEKGLSVEFEATGPARVACDFVELNDALGLLVTSLAQGARGLRVKIETEGAVVCMLERQGPPPTSDQLAWLQGPFATTQQGPLALAFALCSRVASRAGGNVDALPQAQSVTVRLSLPLAAPPVNEP
jgi:hypothetical protein